MESQHLVWTALILIALYLFTQQWMNFIRDVLSRADRHGKECFQDTLKEMVGLLKEVVNKVFATVLRSAFSAPQTPGDPSV